MTPPKPDSGDRSILNHPPDVQIAMMYAKLTAIQAKVEELSALIRGGDHPADGMIVRVDRLEQKSTQIFAALGFVMTAAVGLIVDLVKRYMGAQK